MDKVIQDVLNKLIKHGFQAYIVGGFVRNFLISAEIGTDIDIATDAKPKDVLKIFKSYKTKSFEYGNVLIEIPNYHIEITTFRKDFTYVDKRRPCKIEYVSSMEDDVYRRDFTVNAIYMDASGVIYDILGGQKDLKKHLIKAIGDPSKRIKEDALRIMRAVRFATVLNFKIDKELKLAIINNKELLKDLSYDRKKEELIKIFMSSNKRYGVHLLKELGLVETLELKNIDNVLKTNHMMGIFATCFATTYPLTKREKELTDSVLSLMGQDHLTNEVLYHYGVYPLAIVCDLKRLNKKKYMKRYESLPIKDRGEINITSEEICDLLKVKPSSLIKDIYLDLEKKILNGSLKNDNIIIKKYLKESML